MRHDGSRIARLKNFLYWKDIRKNAKDSDDKGADEVVDVEGNDQQVGNKTSWMSPCTTAD